MIKQIPKATKEEILLKVKNGEKVMEHASQYGISPKTIYNWLRNQVKPDISIMEWNKLKRENEELKRIIGLVTLELERGKKNQNH
jgi:endo-beta-N-acetylglucosaminidase D